MYIFIINIFFQKNEAMSNQSESVSTKQPSKKAQDVVLCKRCLMLNYSRSILCFDFAAPWMLQFVKRQYRKQNPSNHRRRKKQWRVKYITYHLNHYLLLIYYLVEGEFNEQKEYAEFERKINSAASYNELTNSNQLKDILEKMKKMPQEVVETILLPLKTDSREIIFSEILVKVVENALADALSGDVLSKNEFKLCFEGVEKREKAFRFKLIYVTEHIKGRLFYEADFDKYFTAKPKDRFTVFKNGDRTNIESTSMKESLRDGAVKSYAHFMTKNVEFIKQYHDRIRASSIVADIIKTKVDNAPKKEISDSDSGSGSEMDQDRCDNNNNSNVRSESISPKLSGVNLSPEALVVAAEMAKLNNILECLSSAAKMPATVSMDIPMVHAESNTSAFIDGEINLYIYSYLDHINKFLKPMYEKVKNLRNADERDDLLKSFNELYRKALLLKLGVFSEAEKTVSSFRFTFNCHLICFLSLNFALAISIFSPVFSKRKF